ncbi:MAG: CBS domain-containing protein [Acidimicrobiales bacterium]
MLIEQILSDKGSEVVTIRSDATIVDAVQLLRERNIGALVVSDDGEHVVGILSERDVVRSLADGPEVLSRSVADLMTSVVATCDGKATIEQLMAMMTGRRIRHVPVIEGDRLAGIVSIGDVVKARVGELEVEAHALHDYITHGR